MTERRILLATVGLAPQVVTETLYALVHQDPAFVPDEIHIITTTGGRDRTQQMLLGSSGAIVRFAEEFDLPRLATALRPERIHVIADAKRRLLSDISNETGSIGAANLAHSLVREFTTDENSTLHVSIAGGRKTMGFFLGASLSLYARPQDQMSHILVEPSALEQHPDFFFPPRIPILLPDRTDPTRRINTGEAAITLAPIPFIRIGDEIPKRLLSGDWSYSEAVSRAQKLLGKPRLIIDRKSNRVSCNGIVVHLSPINFAFYAWLAERRVRLGEHAGIHHTETPVGELEAAFRHVSGLPEDMIRNLRRNALNGNYPDSDVSVWKNRTNESLTDQLGRADTAFHITVLSIIPNSRFQRQGLMLDPDAISFEELEHIAD